MLAWCSILYLVIQSTAVETSDSERETAFINYSEKKVVGCRDTDASCASWAEQGECQKNQDFMNRSCPVACNTCTPAELNITAYLNELVTFQTAYGEIRIVPNFDNAPRTCALILELAHQSSCPGCGFYRAELAPTKQEGDGPPYGLLQGNLVGLLKNPPHEGSMNVKYGDVAMIQGADFYIAAIDHPGWGSAHTVWGHIADMSVVDKILALPYIENKHPVGTIMRMMKTRVPFTPQAHKNDASEIVT